MEITNEEITADWFRYYRIYYDPQRKYSEETMVLLFRVLVEETKARGEALQS